MGVSLSAAHVRRAMRLPPTIKIWRTDRSRKLGPWTGKTKDDSNNASTCTSMYYNTPDAD